MLAMDFIDILHLPSIYFFLRRNKDFK